MPNEDFLDFIEGATDDFRLEYGREPVSDEDWLDVKQRAQRMEYMRQAARKSSPTVVPGWKFGQDETEWNDA
jgi:hypothetical protein